MRLLSIGLLRGIHAISHMQWTVKPAARVSRVSDSQQNYISLSETLLYAG
jgi:hypothetical protein